MSNYYEVGDVAILTITWLDQTGVQATITGTPTITIKSYDSASNTWTTEVDSQDMTIESGSTWYYEYDTTGQTAEQDYKVFYNAVVDGLNVESTESFRLQEVGTDAATSSELTAAKNEILSQVKELRHGNEKVVFSYSGSRIDSMQILTKSNEDSDWSSPASTKTLYFNYTNGLLSSVGEDS
jgi:hypothetical protein